jgi:hypothetical protein
MASRTLETDYLVVGCGVGGMAFTDSLIAASDAQVVMIDCRHAPGGHWNDAYPFVRLHQPSLFYGVNSMPLGNDSIDRDGLNKGLYERAGGPEICAYFDRVMRERLLPSGQVRYFPLSQYVGENRFLSRLSGDEHHVRVRRKLVDATYLEPSVPATTEAPFEVGPGVRCVPLGELPALTENADGYTIIGAGKTAMDACLWLLEVGVPPEEIRWIKPREPWLINRAYFQGGKLVVNSYEGISRYMEAAAQARSADDFFARLGAAGWLLRTDESVWPTMFKGALATEAELEQLRRIEDVVRLGHVQRIERDAIVLDDGTVRTTAGQLHVHCAASGHNQAPGIPLFTDHRITVQQIRAGVFAFSNAFTGYVEATRGETAAKNRLCPPNRAPHVALDLPRGQLVDSRAAEQWSGEPDVQEWLRSSRLYWLHGLDRDSDEPRVREAHRRLTEYIGPGLSNLDGLLAQAPERR